MTKTINLFEGDGIDVIPSSETDGLNSGSNLEDKQLNGEGAFSLLLPESISADSWLLDPTVDISREVQDIFQRVGIDLVAALTEFRFYLFQNAFLFNYFQEVHDLGSIVFSLDRLVGVFHQLNFQIEGPVRIRLHYINGVENSAVLCLEFAHWAPALPCFISYYLENVCPEPINEDLELLMKVESSLYLNGLDPDFDGYYVQTFNPGMDDWEFKTRLRKV